MAMAYYRSNLAVARIAVKEEGTWLQTWYWPAFLITCALAFIVPEFVAIFNKERGDTLTEKTQKWLGINPRRPAVTGSWAALTTLLVLFVIWFPAHLQAWWPWE